MIKNKLSIEHEIDHRIYQFLIPHEGNWPEALNIAREIIRYIESQVDALNKKDEESIKN